MLGIVQPGAVEPSRPGHRALAENALVGRVRPNPEVVPDRGPEDFEVLDRPGPQLVVARERAAAFALQPGQIAPDLSAPPRIGGRGPQQGAGLIGDGSRHSETSSTTAAPVSPAAHPVNRPMPPPRSSRACIISMIARAPVGPCGCP